MRAQPDIGAGCPQWFDQRSRGFIYANTKLILGWYGAPMSDDYDFLRKEVERLSAEVEQLHKYIRQGAEAIANGDELGWKYCRLIHRDVKEAFDRIINLELTVFPNLQKDMDQVYNVIGEGENKADNPLDRRDPK
jgi:hypothetical protein